MKYKISKTNRYRKELEKAIRRGYSKKKIDKIVNMLANDTPLPKKNYDHSLAGNYDGYRECHIEPNWLLIYKKDGNKLILTLSRTGSHQDLFENYGDDIPYCEIK